jgi:hypothetical protein
MDGKSLSNGDGKGLFYGYYQVLDLKTPRIHLVNSFYVREKISFKNW